MKLWKTMTAAAVLLGASAAAGSAVPLPRLSGADGAASHVVDVKSRSGGGRGGVAIAPRLGGGPRISHGGGKHFGGHRHHRRSYGAVWIAPPVAYYGYSSYGGCGWLKRKAYQTGSSYWWNRYYDCIE